MRGYGILARYTQYGVWHKLEKIPDGLLNGMSKADSKSPAMSWNLNETLKCTDILRCDIWKQTILFTISLEIQNNDRHIQK